MNDYIMMIPSAIGAIISAAVYYVSVLYIDRDGTLGIKKKGYLIQDYRIWMITVSVLISLTWIGYRFFISKTDVLRFFPYVYVAGTAVLSTTDMLLHKVPNKILIILLLCWMGMVGTMLFTNVYRAMETVFFYGMSAIIAGVIFIVTYFISQRKLGMGDVKLSLIMGLFLGNNMIIGAILYGTVLCCVFSVVQVIRKKLSMKDGVPLVPFLYLGSLIVLSIL